MTAYISLPTEPNGYGPKTSPPAPAWLIDAVPGSRPLLAALNGAKEAARIASENRATATRAFREVSHLDRNNEWTPLASVAVDDWRHLRAASDDADAEARRADRAVKAPWLALRAHLNSAPGSPRVANAEVDKRHAELVAAVETLEAASASFREAVNLTPGRFTRRDGIYSIRVDADLASILRELRAVLDLEDAR